MKNTIIVSVIFFSVVGCLKKVPCGDINIQTGFVGFIQSDLDTIILRKFQRDDNHRHLVDTIKIFNNNSLYSFQYRHKILSITECNRETGSTTNIITALLLHHFNRKIDYLFCFSKVAKASLIFKRWFRSFPLWSLDCWHLSWRLRLECYPTGMMPESHWYGKKLTKLGRYG